MRLSYDEQDSQRRPSQRAIGKPRKPDGIRNIRSLPSFRASGQIKQARPLSRLDQFLRKPRLPRKGVIPVHVFEEGREMLSPTGSLRVPFAKAQANS